MGDEYVEEIKIGSKKSRKNELSRRNDPADEEMDIEPVLSGQYHHDRQQIN